MNCQECDLTWNQLLDAESSARRGLPADLDLSPQDLAERERAARVHAQTCPRCQQACSRYETLRRALRAWLTRARPEIRPAEALLQRVLAEQPTRPGRTTRRWRTWLSLAAVACLLVLARIPWKQVATNFSDRGGARNPVGGSVLKPSHHQYDSRVLSDALAEATDATWDLARTTSESAARLGRQVLESAARVDHAAAASISDPSSPSYPGIEALAVVLPTVSQSSPSTDLLQQVGDGVSASVRPLSSTARQAFGFLRIPALDKARNSSIHQPASKGA